MSLSHEAIERLRSRGSLLLRSDIASLEDRSDVEEREYPRVKAPLEARFSVDGGQDVECQLFDVSATGFTLKTMHGVRSGQRVVVHVQVIGTLEGTVVRLLDNGFAVENHYSRPKREKLAATIDWLATQDIDLLKVRRRHERCRPRNGETTMGLNGSAVTVTVIDASRSGAAFSSACPMEVGTVVGFGERHPIRARVVRAWDGGGAVEFLRLLPPERVDPEDGF